MKRVIFVLSLIVALLIPTSARADSAIILTEQSHRQIDGKFIDDELATSLSYNGRLGQLIFAPPKGVRSWQIDAQLVDDVIAMTSDYQLLDGTKGIGKLTAQIWLAQLTSVTRSDAIYALPYGNASGYWINRLSPHNENYFLTVGATRLSNFFGRQIPSLPSYPSNSYFKLDQLTILAFTDAQTAIQSTASYMDPKELDNLHSRIASVFNPNLSRELRDFLDLDLATTTKFLRHQIRLAPGKFTVSSEHQKLPITVINDFPGPVKVNLIVDTLNGKVVAQSVPTQTVPGKSKIQVLIPVQVLTSGSSVLSVGFQSPQGNPLGDSVLYPLQLRVISPIATRITTGAALLLFISALIQSARRIRKRNK